MHTPQMLASRRRVREMMVCYIGVNRVTNVILRLLLSLLFLPHRIGFLGRNRSCTGACAHAHYVRTIKVLDGLDAGPLLVTPAIVPLAHLRRFGRRAAY